MRYCQSFNLQRYKESKHKEKLTAPGEQEMILLAIYLIG
jgi:hypothetical protein